MDHLQDGGEKLDVLGFLSVEMGGEVGVGVHLV